MQRLLTILLLAFPFSGDSSFEQAQSLFEQKQYTEAVSMYQQLLQKYPSQSQQIRYNLAMSYMAMDSLEAALQQMNLAAGLQADVSLQSKALNQLGVWNLRKNMKKDALQFFLNALKTNPENEIARYNYELLKKQIEDEPESPPNPDPDEPDDNSSAQEWKKRFDYFSPQDNSEGLPTIRSYDSIPMPKAIELLDQMRNNELKFLQQLRKSAANANPSSNQSEW